MYKAEITTKWMSTGCTVKCDPETMLSNGAEWHYYLFVTKHGQKENFNFSPLAAYGTKMVVQCLFVTC